MEKRWSFVGSCCVHYADGNCPLGWPNNSEGIHCNMFIRDVIFEHNLCPSPTDTLVGNGIWFDREAVDLKWVVVDAEIIGDMVLGWGS
jgi:hypothetical protein